MAVPVQDGAIEFGRTDPVGSNVRAVSATRRRLDPTKLAYLIGPAAFVVLLLLMQLGYTERQSLWVWLGVFIASPLVSFVCNRLYLLGPTPRRLHIRVAASAASVPGRGAIHLSAWMPAV